MSKTLLPVIQTRLSSYMAVMYVLHLFVLLVLTEHGEQECPEQHSLAAAAAVGVSRAAQHLVLLALTHLNFDFCDV